MNEYNGKIAVLMLCSECNNKCEHCYVDYSGRFSENDLKEIIPELQKKYIVVLNGTEPIMYPEYLKFFKMVGQHKILTNGLALMYKENLMEDLLENEINEIGLSYHFGIQDEISNVKTYMLDKLIKKLKDNGFTVRLLTSLSSDNYAGIEEYCKKAIELGADKLKFTNMVHKGKAFENLNVSKLLNEDQIKSVLTTINNMREKYSKDELLVERCGTFGNIINSNNFECLAGKNMVVITPDRNVYPCVFDISEPIGILNNDNKIMIDEDLVNKDSSYCKVLKKYNNI